MGNVDPCGSEFGANRVALLTVSMAETPALRPNTAVPSLVSAIVWLAVAVAGGGALGFIALSRGETISAACLLIAAVCSYLVAYRFYSLFIADRVFGLDP